MHNRSMFVALSLGAFCSRTAIPDESPAAAPMVAGIGCPGTQANIVLRDYDGDHSFVTCVTRDGLLISAGVIRLNVYDPATDGIFRNDFEQPQ